MGGDVRVIARTLFAALDGLVLQYLAGVDRNEIAAALKEVHRVLILRRDAESRLGSAAGRLQETVRF
jgi:hypothetical protein